MDFSTIIHDRNLQITGVVIVSFFIAGNLAEFIYSYYKHKQYYTYHSFLINISIAFLQQLTDAFNKIVFFMGFVFVQEHYSIQRILHWKELEIDFPFTLFSHFPFLQVNGYMLFIWLFILVVADFCQYWLHRLSHEVNIMWAGHIVHHSMEEYNYTIALRQSFIESIYTWIFYLPLAFFGIPWQLFIMAYAISLIWQFFVHTRLIGKLGFLENILATPSHHRVHHGKNPQYIDKNYGAFFIVWDKVFETFEPEVEAVDYGITVPLQTQNPICVNIHHHLHIFRMMSKTKGFVNKWKIFFGKPAFKPLDIESEYQKLKLLAKPKEVKIPTVKSVYLFFNFLFTALSGFLLVQYFEATFNILLFIPLALLIAFSFAVNIGMLEQKKWADYAEVLKLLSVLAIGLWMFFSNSMNLTMAILIITTTTVMLTYTWVIAKMYRKNLVLLNKRHY